MARMPTARSSPFDTSFQQVTALMIVEFCSVRSSTIRRCRRHRRRIISLLSA